jgi:lysozyme family protein
VDTSTSVRDAYSPEFLSAVERVLADEGGYSSNPNDPGGETKFGISARSNPGVDIATLTRDQAVNIYWREWWLRFGFSQLPDAIGAKTFDLSVNIGAAHAIECLRRALRACGSPVIEDGTLGPATILAARRSNPIALMSALRSEAAGHYRLVAAKQKSGAAFIKGWLNRAYA